MQNYWIVFASFVVSTADVIIPHHAFWVDSDRGIHLDDCRDAVRTPLSQASETAVYRAVRSAQESPIVRKLALLRDAINHQVRSGDKAASDLEAYVAGFIDSVCESRTYGKLPPTDTFADAAATLITGIVKDHQIEEEQGANALPRYRPLWEAYLTLQDIEERRLSMTEDIARPERWIEAYGNILLIDSCRFASRSDITLSVMEQWKTLCDLHMKNLVNNETQKPIHYDMQGTLNNFWPDSLRGATFQQAIGHPIDESSLFENPDTFDGYPEDLSRRFHSDELIWAPLKQQVRVVPPNSLDSFGRKASKNSLGAEWRRAEDMYLAQNQIDIVLDISDYLDESQPKVVDIMNTVDDVFTGENPLQVNDPPLLDLLMSINDYKVIERSDSPFENWHVASSEHEPLNDSTKNTPKTPETTEESASQAIEYPVIKIPDIHTKLDMDTDVAMAVQSTKHASEIVTAQTSTTNTIDIPANPQGSEVSVISKDVNMDPNINLAKHENLLQIPKDESSHEGLSNIPLFPDQGSGSLNALDGEASTQIPKVEIKPEENLASSPDESLQGYSISLQTALERTHMDSSISSSDVLPEAISSSTPGKEACLKNLVNEATAENVHKDATGHEVRHKNMNLVNPTDPIDHMSVLDQLDSISHNLTGIGSKSRLELYQESDGSMTHEEPKGGQDASSEVARIDTGSDASPKVDTLPIIQIFSLEPFRSPEASVLAKIIKEASLVSYLNASHVDVGDKMGLRVEPDAMAIGACIDKFSDVVANHLVERSTPRTLTLWNLPSSNYSITHISPLSLQAADQISSICENFSDVSEDAGEIGGDLVEAIMHRQQMEAFRLRQCYLQALPEMEATADMGRLAFKHLLGSMLRRMESRSDLTTTELAEITIENKVIEKCTAKLKMERESGMQGMTAGSYANAPCETRSIFEAIVSLGNIAHEYDGKYLDTIVDLYTDATAAECGFSDRRLHQDRGTEDTPLYHTKETETPGASELSITAEDVKANLSLSANFTDNVLEIQHSFIVSQNESPHQTSKTSGGAREVMPPTFQESSPQSVSSEDVMRSPETYSWKSEEEVSEEQSTVRAKGAEDSILTQLETVEEDFTLEDVTIEETQATNENSSQNWDADLESPAQTETGDMKETRILAKHIEEREIMKRQLSALPDSIRTIDQNIDDNDVVYPAIVYEDFGSGDKPWMHGQSLSNEECERKLVFDAKNAVNLIGLDKRRAEQLSHVIYKLLVEKNPETTEEAKLFMNLDAKLIEACHTSRPPESSAAVRSLLRTAVLGMHHPTFAKFGAVHKVDVLNANTGGEEAEGFKRVAVGGNASSRRTLRSQLTRPQHRKIDFSL